MSNQHEYWNGKPGEIWAQNADALDRMLRPFSDIILQQACLEPAQKVLDIGCGAGTLAFAAEDQVGPAGAVTGLDISTPILSVARQRCKAQNRQIEFVLGDAAEYHPAGPVDAVLSRFGVMFFEDPAAGFYHIRTFLKEEGRLSFICWQEAEKNPWATGPVMAIREMLADPPPSPPPHAPGPFALGDRDRLEAILTGAGWKDIQITPWTDKITIPADGILEALQFTTESGPLSRLLTPEDLEREDIRDTLKEYLSRHMDETGRVQMDGAAWCVTALA